MENLENNIFNENILSDIKLIESNIPNNLTTLEKIRWVYINLGKVFCYDYRVGNNVNYAYDKIIDFNSHIGRYQTCLQISEVLNHILNQIDGVKSKTIDRVLNNLRGNYGQEHVGNEVEIIEDGVTLKLILDLTLDLYLIQSNCHTLHFGYQDDGSGTYDIISQYENEKMDTKLGFINNKTDYTDYKIDTVFHALNEIKENISSPEDYINLRLSVINDLNLHFYGYHEGKQYVNMLFNKLLEASYKEFNLYFNDDGQFSLKTVYLIEYNGFKKWIIYSNKVGFINTDENIISNMLNNGWFTKSETLMDIIYNSKKKI